MNNAEMNAMIVAAGATGPRITMEMVEAEILDIDYWNPPGTTLTVCCITLQNGFTVTGEAGCAAPANFRPELGRPFSLDAAKKKIWPLLGYILAQKLYEKETHL